MTRRRSDDAPTWGVDVDPETEADYEAVRRQIERGRRALRNSDGMAPGDYQTTGAHRSEPSRED